MHNNNNFTGYCFLLVMVFRKGRDDIPRTT